MQSAPLVHAWFQINYVPFLSYAIKNFRSDLGTYEDREDAVSDLIVKALSTNAFEKRLSNGQSLSYGSLLRFCEQRHYHNMDRDARDWCGRAGGLRTRKELKEEKVEYGTEIPDFGGKGVKIAADADADPNARAEFDVVCPEPSPLEMVIVDETYEMIMHGMFKEWGDAPLETRLRVLELLRSGGNQGDIQRMLEVGPTRAKTFKSEIRAVTRHALRPSAPRRKKPVRTPEAPSLAERVKGLVKDTHDPLEGLLEGTSIPNYDRIDTIEHAIKAKQGEKVEEGVLPESRRHQLYLDQAMRILGVLDSEGVVTDLGDTVCKKEGDFRMVLGLLFEASVVGQAWIHWAKVNAVTDLDPSTSVSFLAECSSLSVSTRDRRARTLRRWASFIQLEAGKIS